MDGAVVRKPIPDCNSGRFDFAEASRSISYRSIQCLYGDRAGSVLEYGSISLA